MHPWFFLCISDSGLCVCLPLSVSWSFIVSLSIVPLSLCLSDNQTPTCKESRNKTDLDFFFLIFFKFIIYLLFLFLAVLGLRLCARAFSSCGKRGPLFIAVRGPLTIAASLVAEHRLQTLRLSSCGSRAQSLRGMWDPPRPGLEPVSPALAGRLSTTAPPGKPPDLDFYTAHPLNSL